MKALIFFPFNLNDATKIDFIITIELIKTLKIDVIGYIWHDFHKKIIIPKWEISIIKWNILYGQPIIIVLNLLFYNFNLVSECSIRGGLSEIRNGEDEGTIGDKSN